MQNHRGRLALFIDGVKFHATARALGFEIDYKRLLDEFSERGTLLRAFYYTTVMDDLEYCTVRPLVDWLDYNGFTVVTKPIRESLDDAGRRRVKANMDIDLAVGAMDVADHVDEIVLFSGDGSFRPLVAALQRRGVRVTIVSTVASEPPILADELRRQADEFIDLAALQAKLGRAPSTARATAQHPIIPVERRGSTDRLAAHSARLTDSNPENE
jgi:uncharacterized LabA/DUF88 family protein